jgi:hypothetical protein
LGEEEGEGGGGGDLGAVTKMSSSLLAWAGKKEGKIKKGEEKGKKGMGASRGVKREPSPVEVARGKETC